MSNKNDKVWDRSLDDIMSESFGKYAKYIIQDRALPDVRDGLKPVQRRILHAMNELKIHYDKPYKKSARSVGEVIGKYHPHGDSSIYEAMVRMSQEWKNNIPLLDMQGNKGSIDGDSPAAMRYTECRLSKYGQIILKDIDKNTVKFINNFDDSESEPTVLPSLLPNILINGATGIAAGYATNIPPFNPAEVIDGTIYRILKPTSTLAELSKIVKGPDFPTGGIIQGKEFINEIYKTGKGRFFVRAKIEEEPTRSNKNIKRLIVKEIPYDTNKSAIIKSLDEIKYNNELPGLREVRDDSDKNGIAIVLEFETEKDLEIIKTFLYKKTQLQIVYNANMVLIKDRKPLQASLTDILDAFIEHANDVIIKAAKYDLEKSLLRKEIIEGLIKAISQIDILVNLIKSSVSKDEAKIKVQDYFKVNERQSEAIVNLRLYVLTSFDTEKLKKEYEELLEFIKEKELIINSIDYRNKFIISILEGYRKSFGYKRRTLIEDEVEELEIETTDIIEEKNGVCIVTRDNYIKFIDDIKLEEVDLSKTKFKDGDIPVDIFKLSTLDHLVCVTSRGKLITIPAYKIKMTKLRENGIHVNELITIDSFEKSVLAFAVSKYSDVATKILIATKNSLIKRISLDNINLSKTAKSVICANLKSSNDEVVSAHVLKDEYKEVIAVTQSGYATRYQIEEIPVVGRGAAGVKNMSLKDNDAIAFTVPIPRMENFLFFISNRGAKRIHINDIIATSRSKCGKRIFQQVDSNPYSVNSGFIVSGRSNVFILLETNQLISFKVAETPISEVDSRMNSIASADKSSILKGSYLFLDKSFIKTNENNNFLTLSNEKEVLDESKENEDDSKENEVNFEDENVEVESFEKLKSKLEKRQPKAEDYVSSSASYNILKELDKNNPEVGKDDIPEKENEDVQESENKIDLTNEDSTDFEPKEEESNRVEENDQKEISSNSDDESQESVDHDENEDSNDSSKNELEDDSSQEEKEVNDDEDSNELLESTDNQQDELDENDKTNDGLEEVEANLDDDSEDENLKEEDSDVEDDENLEEELDDSEDEDFEEDSDEDDDSEDDNFEDNEDSQENSNDESDDDNDLEKEPKDLEEIKEIDLNNDDLDGEDSEEDSEDNDDFDDEDSDDDSDEDDFDDEDLEDDSDAEDDEEELDDSEDEDFEEDSDDDSENDEDDSSLSLDDIDDMEEDDYDDD